MTKHLGGNNEIAEIVEATVSEIEDEVRGWVKRLDSLNMEMQENRKLRDRLYGNADFRRALEILSGNCDYWIYNRAGVLGHPQAEG